ncbi:MAG TPA: bifunctional phosphopantothenoylcysteine decarboxylase/phosphopantothenate--cysteine ligase CoaBC [Blastocatellia bacterium]|nr:bifunctional phosphopantothenoylcysteine decarboxylase/phosphopantothenate--cysteine ligase CoaBC [Blastocatellia bacterium]
MNILLGVTGCIGAYKAAEILRGLQRGGASVRVVMTRHATDFVQPLTFEALSGKPVATDMFAGADHSKIEHISFAREADLLLVAPATANTIAKFAHGIADDFLSTLYLSNTNPVLIAPAMNVEMWRHPATQANIAILRERGVQFVEPESGYQACGEIGVGRLAEVETIVQRAFSLLQPPTPNPQSLTDYSGEHVLITAGPTVEDIDPVRFITNRSSGKMGYALAEAAFNRGAQVTLVSGPTKLKAPEGVNFVSVRSTSEMYNTVINHLSGIDIFIGCAAVADYRPVNRAEQKIKKQGRKGITIELEATEDIIAAVGNDPNRNGRIVVGFAAESELLLDNADKKLREKGLDLIVANDITRADAGFDVETNAATIIRRNGSRTELPLQSKRELADAVLNEVILVRNSKHLESHGTP